MKKRERKNGATARTIAKSVVSVVTLMIALQLFRSLLSYSETGFLPAALFLAWAVYETLLVFELRKESKLDFVRHLINTDIFLACTVLLIAGGPKDNLLEAAGGLFGLTLALSRVFAIIRKHSVRSVILNILAIIMLFSLFLALSSRFATANLFSIILPMIHIISVAFSQIKISILKRIIRKTFALEILFGMLLLIVAISIVLPGFEPGIESFSDGLWYCFAIVTTIGFGDFTAVSGIGRLLSVILGIYGIIVVSLITSIIVNFYSEVKSDPDEDENKDENTAELKTAIEENKTEES